MSAADEDPIRIVKKALFGEGVAPDRPYVQFLADTLRWPVDKHVTRTVSAEKGTQHHITWLKGGVIGHATVDGTLDPPTASSTIYPLANVIRAEVGAEVRDDGLSQTVSRKITLALASGESLTVDPSTFSQYLQRESVEPFIDHVLSALGDATSAAGQ